MGCEQCGSEAILTKAGDAQLECCGVPLTVTFEPAPSGVAGKDEG